MFMMPMPPTSRDGCDRRQQESHNLGGLLSGLHHLGKVPHREILLLTGADPVALAEQFIDLFFRRRQLIGAFRLYCNHPDHPHERRPEDLFLRRREGNEDCVVLILTAVRLTLWRQDADDHEGNLLDPDDMAYRVRVAEEVVHDGLPQETNLGGVPHVLLREDPSGGERPVPNGQDAGGGPVDPRRPVLIAVNHLGRTVVHGGHIGNGRALPGDGFGVVLRQGGLRAASHPEAAGGAAPRHDDQEVAADACHLLGDPFACAGPDGEHRDHRTHADDDPEHGQRGAHLVDPEGAERYLES